MKSKMTFVLQICLAGLAVLACATARAQTSTKAAEPAAGGIDLVAIEKPRIMAKADKYLSEEPKTVTASHSPRSKGGEHDFFSEGDYWWPDPNNPNGPYIQKDGQTNPDNFVDHRLAMQRLAEIVGTMASAWTLTQNDKYAAHGVKHVKAWFVDPETLMNPNLQYSQAIMGRNTGRSIGIIDTYHLVEVARGILVMRDSKAFPKEDFEAIQKWFREYLDWLTKSEFGIAERDAGNNHSICWSAQAAAFAEVVGDADQLAWVRDRFKTIYIGEHMADNGSLPREIRRTKPYGYSLFTIDALAAVAQLASTPDDNLWTYKGENGKGMEKGLEYIHPYIKDKEKWLADGYKKDIMYWDDWPVRHPALVLGGFALNKPEYLETAFKLEADPTVPEVIRNLPLRHPLLWVNPDGTPRRFIEFTKQ